MGDAMEEGTIVRWLKNEGDPVAEQEVIAEIATEKANIEIPATDAGVLSRILVKENETVPVGTPIAVIGNGKEPAPKAEAKPATPARSVSEAESAPKAEAKEAKPAADVEQKPSEQKPSPQAAPEPVRERDNGQGGAPVPGALRVKATPLAKKVAAEHGLDLARVSGTGPGGRIVEGDVVDALQRGPAPGAQAPGGTAAIGIAPVHLPGSERPLSPMRKIIAKRLSESKQTIPHFYLNVDVDMRAAARIRAEFNGSVEEERKISFNDLVIRASVLALQKHRALTSQLAGEVIKTPSSINVGIAVSLDEGLIVPVIKDAQNKGISAIAQEVRELAGRARKGGLKPDEYSGGGFSISNLGMYEITQFQAIINPPEVAILAVGAIRDTPIVENGQVVPGKQMFLTISVDHRVVDGSVAAEFMQELKRLLQSPMGLFS